MTSSRPPLQGWLKAYAAALLVLLALDAIWLGLIARGFYMSEMSAVLADEVQVLPAAVFYLAVPLAAATACGVASRRSANHAA